MKTCSFCKKDVPRLWYSKPPCCANNYCKEQYRRKKGKPKTKINPFSSKKLSEIAKYRPLRDKYMNEHKHCEAKIRGVCTHYSVDLHHVKSREFFLCDVSVFMAVCRQCHTWIEQNDAEAQKLGFKKSKHER